MWTISGRPLSRAARLARRGISIPKISSAGETMRALIPLMRPLCSRATFKVLSRSMLLSAMMSGFVASPVWQMCSSGIPSVSHLGRMWRGNALKVAQPELPASTTVVTPACTPAMSGWTPLAATPSKTWVWRSMSPGVTVLPGTWMTRRASDAGMFAVTAAIFPSWTATSRALLRSCAGSMTTPPFSTRSYMGEPPPTGCPESTRPASTLSSRACYRHPAPEAREERRAGRNRGREDERRRADPRQQADYNEDGASLCHRFHGRLVLLTDRHPVAEPSGRDRESEQEEGHEEHCRHRDQRDPDDRHGQHEEERGESQEDGDPGKRRESGSMREVFPHPHQGAGEGDRNEERDDVEQDGAGRARGEAEHRVHIADRPANHRPDHRRDRSAEAHVVAFERGALPDRHGAADRDRVAFDARARQQRDRAADRHGLSLNVTRDRDGAADGHGLVDGLVGADRQGLAEHDALGPVTTTPLTPSPPPGIPGRCGSVRADAEDAVSERGPERAGLEDQIEHLAGGALPNLNGERAGGRALRRGDHETPARLLGDCGQRVENRPARLIDGDDGSVVGKSPLEPPAVRRGRPDEARQQHESDDENDDQLGCAHVRSPFAREYGRARRLFHERQRSRPRDEDQGQHGRGGAQGG